MGTNGRISLHHFRLRHAHRVEIVGVNEIRVSGRASIRQKASTVVPPLERTSRRSAERRPFGVAPIIYYNIM